MPTRQRSSAPRLVLGRYFVDEESRVSGGIADVYRATDVQASPPIQVAVKVLRSEEHPDELLGKFYRDELEALTALRHPNIVTLFDQGVEGSERVIVMEWMPVTLLDHIAALGEPLGWDDFVEAFALPLLSGLSHAHQRGIVHRDLKPSNVLVAPGNIPKLADFSISKIKYQLDPDPRTVADWSSPPFCPPDLASRATYRRDVFSFGVLALACVTDVEMVDYPDISLALEAFDGPDAARELLRECTSTDPMERPEDAAVLRAQIEDLARDREGAGGWRELPSVWFTTTWTVRKLMAQLTGLDEADERAIAAAVQADLSTAVHGEPARSDADFACILFGEEYRFKAVLEAESPAFKLIHVRRDEPSMHDRARERHPELPFQVRIGQPINVVESLREAAALRGFLTDWEEQRDIARVAEGERWLFEQWSRQLRAREEAERRKETPLPFADCEGTGRRLVFRLAEEPVEDLVGQRREIRSSEGFARFAGEVEELTGNRLVLYLDRLPRGDPPRRGELVVDIEASKQVLDRQRAALSALRYRSAELVRSDLPDLILDPAKSQSAEDHALVTNWHQPELDDSKREAIAASLNSPDFFVLEGPPGTGKTAFIAELISQQLDRHPDSRVVLASQTNVALDNALQRLRQMGFAGQIVRLGRPDTHRVAESVTDLLLDTQRERWRSEVQARSEAFLEELSIAEGLDLSRVRAALRLGELIGFKAHAAAIRDELDHITSEIHPAAYESGVSQSLRDELAGREADLRSELSSVRRDIDEHVRYIAPVLQASPSEVIDLEAEVLEGLALDCFPSATPNSEQLRQLVLLQGRWLQRVGRGEEFDEAILTSSHVIAATCGGLTGLKAARGIEYDLCIVDEASKANATEAIVPLVKSRRWVLVGDRAQLPPFQDDALRDRALQAEFDLDSEELTRTLFDRLAEGVPESSRRILTVQHRMTKSIADLVSDCFYGGQLETHEPDRPEYLAAVIDPPTWYSTERISDRGERRSGVSSLSFSNRREAISIADYLENLSGRVRWITSGDGQPPARLTVLILSGYRSQVAEIDRHIRARTNLSQYLDIEVNTIDAAQGREADVSILSVTRSNSDGNVGFLRSMNRVNVAVSRGRFGLAVFGDAACVRVREGPLGKVLDHLERHPPGQVEVL